MSARTSPTIEEMAAHIVSEVQYDMRHGKPVSSSCEYAERRLKEMVAAAREEGRAAGYAEAIEKAADYIDMHAVVTSGEIRALAPAKEEPKRC